MTTYRQILPVSFNNDELPRFTVDPILTTGSVWLVDPTHPIEPWGPGVPENMDTVPNLVAHHPEFLPDDVEDAMEVSFVADGNLANEFGTVERTTKGGLHIILGRDGIDDFLSHSGGKYYAALQHVCNPTPTEWSTRMYGTTGANGAYQHSFYLSTWMHITREQGDNGDEPYYASLFGRASQGHLTVAHRMKTSTGHRQSPQIKDVTEGVHFNASSSPSPLSTATMSSTTDLWAYPFIGGHVPSYNRLAGTREYAPSMILYRSYLEDLTVSGRTFEQVAAIDQAMFERDCLTPGGRYYGDEFTDPDDYFGGS